MYTDRRASDGTRAPFIHQNSISRTVDRTKWKQDSSFPALAAQNASTMDLPIAGAIVAIFGIESAAFGCSCEHHSICGKNVDHDTLIRFKRAVVEGGKWQNSTTCLNSTFLTVAFDAPEHNQDKCVMGAYWVSEGADRCLMGHVNEGLKDLFPALDGRLAQVTEIYVNLPYPGDDDRK